MAISSNFDDREFNKILSQAVDAVKDFVNGISIRPGTSERKRLALLVLNNMVGKSDSVLTLAEAGKGAGIDVIVRSAFENQFDLINLFKYPKEYPAYMFYPSDIQPHIH